MKFTKQADVCQHCGKRPATTRIEFEETGWQPSPENRSASWWSEDWCDECAEKATDYRSLSMLPKPVQ